MRVESSSSISEGSAHEGEGEEDDNESNCGVGSCTPHWIQVFNSPKAFLVSICWCSLLQGLVVNGFNNINTTSVERRFNLPSFKVAMVSSAYDFSAGFFVIFISYLGANGHKPRWLAAAGFIFGIGSLTMSLPHFITGLYEYGDASVDTCRANGSSTADALCSQDEAGLQNYLYLLILGQVLHGVGGTTLYTLGPVFIDENVETKSSPLYIGILYGFAAIGPAIGYILGGKLLDFYVDIFAMDISMVDMTPEDPRWVGAWWIGFFVAGFLFFTTILAFVPFPRVLKGTKALQAKRISEVHQDGGEDLVSRPGFGKSIRDMPTAAAVILKNPTFIFVTLAGCTEGLATSGFATFLSKFIQNQFDQTAGWAAMLAGFLAVPGAAGGQFVGGLIANRMRLKVRGMIRLCVIASTLGALTTPIFWSHCTKTNFAGLSKEHVNSSLPSVSTSCNINCNCSTTYYTPVCGQNDMQYFSACHAGCVSSSSYTNGSKFYHDCGCIPRENNMATAGECESSCQALNYFMPIAFITIFLTFMPTAPVTSITLRCIPSNQRSFGIGLQWVFIRFLATVPGPLLFGGVIDSSCLVWQDKCNEQGSCWIYDNFKMSMTFFILAASLKISSSILFSLAYLKYKAPGTDTLLRTQSAITLVNSYSEASIDGSINQEKRQNKITPLYTSSSANSVQPEERV